MQTITIDNLKIEIVRKEDDDFHFYITHGDWNITLRSTPDEKSITQWIDDGGISQIKTSSIYLDEK